MVVFEVFLVPGADPATLLSPEILKETGAQVMTLEGARSVGFGGLADPPDGKVVRLIAVRKRDAPWIHRTLETNEAAGGFQMHDVD